VFRTTSTDRTVVEALIEAAHEHGMGRVAVEDPLAGALSYRKLLLGMRMLGEKLMPLAPEAGRRRDAAERQRRGGDAAGADVGGPRAGDDQLHRRRANMLAACRAAKVDTS
jgi:acyl-[acyl-carrier-protein]-phospholipid O-acyltransferase / long-chain-fatty-acid--[acyl-carrier-protein] ligase